MPSEKPPPSSIRPSRRADAALLLSRRVDGKAQLWIRPLDSLTGHPLPGTDDASQTFWSPDSRFLGFFAQGKLKKIDVSGGPPQALGDVSLLPRGRVMEPLMAS